MLSRRPRGAPRETSARPPYLLLVASPQSAAQGASRLAQLHATQIPAPPPRLPRPQPSAAAEAASVQLRRWGPTASIRAAQRAARALGKGRDGDRTTERWEVLSLSLSKAQRIERQQCLFSDSIRRPSGKGKEHWDWSAEKVSTQPHPPGGQQCLTESRGKEERVKVREEKSTETSLRDSKSKLLQTSVSVHPDAIEKTIDDIMELKKINPDINPQLGISLQACLLQIVGYRNLIADVEKLRREPYDSENPQHEEMLLKLWKFLKPNTPLESRISKQWCEIGFQGDDPKTDFRGMGLLGLYNLQYFAERDATAAQQVLSDSLHPKCRYSFAIVGINITDLAYNLLVSGALKTHFYNIAPEAPTLSHFQQTFCYLMHEFHKFWIEEDPMDIMEFNRVREKFRKRIIKQLQNPDMALCPHFAASEGLINM
ncbi:ELMO domain-containing protein 1 [Sciurus carolinensis]|uniref:ELMO domain-containing protein 1 n=1 Tax=Sciurus carolinensis TaxID=30640 RepID=A0AA41N5P1_SCICA|nr:ELMO domain-containing protein 1 [Sciurus carolinensis]